MDTYEEYTSWLRAAGCSERTIQDRLGMLRRFARAYPTFPTVSAGQITTWIGRPSYAAWSKATYYGHLRSYFTYALENDLLTVDPMARMRRPKPGKCVPRPLTSEQVDAVMSCAQPNVRAWLTLGLFAGLRASEIAKIRAEDIQEDAIFILGKGGQEAYVPTHPAIWAMALSLPRTGWLFPSPPTPGHVRTQVVSAVTSALFTTHGIEGSIHRMRHTFATRLLRAGVNIRVVQTLMRHASLASTMIYCAVDEVERRDAISRLVAA